MRWMQISDIHKNLTYNKTATLKQQDQLVAYIRKNNLKIDYLFLTGDYRDSGYLKLEYALPKENLEEQAKNVADYILKIAEALHLNQEQIFLVPGNHDLDRSNEDEDYVNKIKKSHPDTRSGLSREEQRYLWKRFCFYEMIDRTIHPKEKQERAGHRFYELKDCNILCLNTALTCTGKERKGDLLLDTNEIYEMLKDKGEEKPCFVLAHHNLEYFIDSDRVIIEDLFKGKTLYYLCGHEHKSCVSKDFTNDIWTIMTGTIKKIKQGGSSFTIGEISPFHTLLNLDIYSFDDKTNGYINESLFKNEIHFVYHDNKNAELRNAEIVQLPLRYASDSTEEQRQKAIKTLVEMKSKLNIMNPTGKFIIKNDSLSLNAAILIGCAMHSGKGIQITCIGKFANYENGVNSKPIDFEIKKESDLAVLDVNKKVNICIYIQAKNVDFGKPDFDTYVKDMENTYILSFMHVGKYDNNTNLLESAKIIMNKILEIKDELTKQGYQQLSYHIFFNGMWELALFIGTQMKQFLKYQLYDYADEKYHRAFMISPRDFDPVS